MPDPPTSSRPGKISVVLIKPSKYDDDGYVLRYRKGFLPSNTLACLAALTEEVRRSGTIASADDWDIRILDDTVQPIRVARIARSARRPGHVMIVGLVGVQTNQFSRASDLALAFREQGATVLVGGFHVSGSFAMFDAPTPEIETLLHAGVSVVAGEVEDQWEAILRDAVHGTLKPVYNLLGQLPDLHGRPTPRVEKRYLRRFITANYATIDCSRGCPFHCSFCTIINVQGRKMRSRDVPSLLADVRNNFLHHDVSCYFLTDDNFARNPHWEEIFDGFIRLREEEHLPVEFMMQVDVLSYRIKNFITKARRAGCTQVFIGMESLNPRNLAAAQKTQNDVRDLENLIAAYHREEIMTHAAYIIGLPHDTVSSVREDVEQLTQRLRVKQASFFMLTPLPGSHDHRELVLRGAPLDADLNQYDACHATTEHPLMSRQEWMQAFHEAWESFYSVRNMRQILADTSPERYWNVFKNILWARISMSIEQGHPMLTGLLRRKERVSRRMGFPVESVWTHAFKRIREMFAKGKAWVELFWEMEEVWLATRQRSEQEAAIIEEIRTLRSNVHHWRELRTHELQEVYRRVSVRIGEVATGTKHPVRIPSRVRLFLRRFSITDDRIMWSRQHLNAYWRHCRHSLARGRLLSIHPYRFAANLVGEIRLDILFALAMFASGIR